MDPALLATAIRLLAGGAIYPHAGDHRPPANLTPSEALRAQARTGESRCCTRRVPLDAPRAAPCREPERRATRPSRASGCLRDIAFTGADARGGRSAENPGRIDQG